MLALDRTEDAKKLRKRKKKKKKKKKGSIKLYLCLRPHFNAQSAMGSACERIQSLLKELSGILSRFPSLVLFHFTI